MIHFSFSVQIKAHLKDTVSFSIEHVHKDYSLYENVSINPDDFGHVIEIYDFPSFFKTEDLLDAFSDFRCERKDQFLSQFCQFNLLVVMVFSIFRFSSVYIYVADNI